MGVEAPPVAPRRTGDGSEFLLQAKDEVGPRSWGGEVGGRFGGFWGRLRGVMVRLGGLGSFVGFWGCLGGRLLMFLDSLGAPLRFGQIGIGGEFRGDLGELGAFGSYFGCLF